MHQPNAQTASYYKVTISLDETHISYQGKVLQLTNGMRAQSTLFLEKGRYINGCSRLSTI